MSTLKKISIVIPIYNESENIIVLLKELLKILDTILGGEIIIVDDCSTDNGAELVLDADADTTLHADTDDEIDVQVAGNDIITIKQSSGDGILQIPVDAKDLIFQQADGNKLFEINDGNFVGVGGNATAPGEIRIFEAFLRWNEAGKGAGRPNSAYKAPRM